MHGKDVINWSQIRSEDSKQASFELLCSQVARLKKPSSGIEFIPNGNPDGGVDCYWKLKNSDIHAWQAKFFHRLEKSQWAQIDSSVKDAIENYPKLTKYTVCVPLNLPNSGQNSARQKWEQHKEKWLKLKSDVEYIFHGHDEFVNLLSNDAHRGKLKYFFGGISFTQTWFNDQMNMLKEAIGLRYSEEYNVDLPIIKKFNALCETSEFIINMQTYSNNLDKNLKYVNYLSNKVNIDFKIHNEKIVNLINKLKFFNRQTEHDIKIKDLVSDCDSINIELESYENRIESYDMFKSSDPDMQDNNKDNQALHQVKNKLRNARSSLRQNLYTLQIFLEENICVDTRQIIVTGDAGMGKTHLFFDVLQKRLENNHATILLLGQWFDKDPLNEIPELLGLDCNINEFFDAFNSHAEATGHKALLLIDALNESPNENIWENHLKRLSKIISKYKSISFAISVRSGYVKKYDNIIPDRCTHVEHKGFQDNPKKYVDVFFTKNGLVSPMMPFLRQEFSTPQFLYLLCIAMKEKQIENISYDSLDILSVYELYIKTINKKLCKSDKLDYDENNNIVEKGINELAKLMMPQLTLELDYDVANNCLMNVHHSERNSKSLLYNLIQEGILLRDHEKNKVRFVYERLSEHLIVREYLNEFEHNTIKKSFCEGGKLFKFFNGDNFYNNNSGIIDAILIQLPDKFDIELAEIIPDILNNPKMVIAILGSLPLRKSNNITTKTIESLQKIILDRGNVDDYFKALLTLTIKANHGINANYLHQKLLSMKMSKRDLLWSTFIHRQYINNGIVFNYINWAQNVKCDTNSKEQISLAATTMCWFLTSSHKIIRDNVITALIELMHSNAEEWLIIFKKFKNCNDPYVVANLYAVTYAIVLTNTTSKSQIEKTALYVYSEIFVTNNPPHSIFIQDYARRIINYANIIIPNLQIVSSNVEPPYKNTVLRLPKINKMELLVDGISGRGYDNCNVEDQGLLKLNFSLSEMGDFVRYTLGSNSDTFPWHNIKLKHGKSIIDDVQRIFKKSPQLSQLLCKYIENLENQKKIMWHNSTKKNKKHNKINYRMKIQKILNPHDRIIFNKIVDPYLKMKYANAHSIKDLPKFDIHALRNWISNKIITIGWKKEYFGEFDSDIRDYGDLDKKYERIGKKYQWLAHYELLSKISNKYEFKSMNNIYQKYFGVWQLSHLQTTDPTWIRKKNKNDDIEMTSREWFPTTQCASNNVNATKWLKDKTNVPNVYEILQVRNSDEWLTLHGTYVRKYSIKKDNSDITRNLFLTVNSYLCDKKYTKKISQYFNSTKNTIKRFEPSYDTFLGELYWHESVREDVENTEWFECDDNLQTMPAKLYPTTYGLLQESVLTHDLESNMRILSPNKLLFDKMNLINNLNGRYSDSNKNTITFNAMFDKDHQFLLIKKKEFLEFLTKNRYDVIWQVWGKKEISNDEMESIKSYMWMDLDGIYTLSSDKISGNLSHTFKKTPHSELLR